MEFDTIVGIIGTLGAIGTLIADWDKIKRSVGNAPPITVVVISVIIAFLAGIYVYIPFVDRYIIAFLFQNPGGLASAILVVTSIPLMVVTAHLVRSILENILG